VLLCAAAQQVLASGYVIGNIDATIIAQSPKLAPYLPAMIANLATDLELEANCLNLKAKTNERLGWEGREEGIAAHALALLIRG